MIAAIAGGGAIAVGLYHRRHLASTPITSNMGAKLGAAAGTLGYLVFAILTVIAFVFEGDTLRSEMLKHMQDLPRQATDPQSQEMLRRLMEKFSTPEGAAMLVTISLATLFFVFLGFAALGGIGGAALTRRTDARR
jgi:hypothetical protein